MTEFGAPSRLGDYVDLQRGNTYKGSLLGQPGPVLLGLASIARNGGFRSDNLKTYGGQSDPRMLLRSGDMYVSLKDVTQSADLLGAVSRVPDNIHEGRLTQDTVKLVFKVEDASKDYIYWILRTPLYREYCRAHATGTTNLGLPREDFLAFPIPALTASRTELVAFLQALEDKINLNRRMNETLEAMARALFTDWFADFGPTRAKMEGRAPYLASEIWKLFPDRLDEQGKPEGWIDVTVSSIANRIGMGPFGSNIKVETFVDSGVPIISGKHLRGTRLDDSEFNFVTEVHAEQLLSANVQRGDIIFTHAGNIGQVSIIPESSRYDRYVLSQRQFYLRCNSEVVSRLFVIYFFKSHEGQHKLLANTSQVGVPSISRPTTNLKQISLVLPSKPVLAAFDALIGPFHSRSGINDGESGTLHSTRDLLLDKLMSGEIRVKDAEKIAATAL
jgi:type I restriction enzyme, S subunit